MWTKIENILQLKVWMRWVNPNYVCTFVGQAMKEATAHCSARPLPPPREPFMWLSGLEDLVVTKERFQFLNVGER